MKHRFKLLIAGGKTGGHLFPGIAVAQALKAANPNANVLFVGTDAPFEVATLKTYGFDHKAIISKPIKGGSPIDKITSTCIILVSLIQSLIILARFKPDFVLGVGGFSSFAVVLAAWILRIPRAIQEQNSIPGITNRLLARFSDTIFTAFETTKGMPSHKIQYEGNPIRQTSPQTRESNRESDRKLNQAADINPDDFIILVTGGSQGAASINTAFIRALEQMTDLKGVHIIHQTGLADEARMRDAYQKIAVRSTVQAFFHDMPALQDIASLAITRAGASTISELSIKGVPAIFVPFPHAADDHQTYNAKVFEEKGAAIVIADSDLTGSLLKTTLQALMADKQKLKQMGIAFKQLAMPDADKRIAAKILNTKDLRV
jgi:UDP-N-acetylglucosamine--N-acetylmuramyl-(pentapeptide) pyrophosphoryl-undecaprenol N-acetylglucosamine transferase